MKLEFNSVEELRDFVKSHLKGQRGRGGGAEDDASVPAGPQPGTGSAPAPAMPPQATPGGFQPPAGFPAQPAAAFPGVSQADPAIAAIVARIVTRIDGAIAGGQPPDAVLTWFRSQCGPEAANATLDQIKQVFLGKLAMPALEGIAKLMNA